MKRRAGMEALSVSALDLFASALGVFILITILMFPYYLRQPSLEAAVGGAEARLAATALSIEEAEKKAEAEAERKAEALETLALAQERLQQAEQAAAAAAQEQGEAEPAIKVVQKQEGAPGKRDAALTITDLDVVFVMDTTGSMRDELADVQASLFGIIRILHRLAPTLSVGFVAYRDHGQAYVTQTMPLLPMTNTTSNQLLAFVRGLRAEKGGDIPEAIDVALDDAMAMDWRANAQGRIVLIGDAPPRASELQKTYEQIASFRGSATDPRYPKLVSAIFTGREPGIQAYFEQVAEIGGGDFTKNQGQMLESILVSVLREPDEVWVANR